MHKSQMNESEKKQNEVLTLWNNFNQSIKIYQINCYYNAQVIKVVPT